VWGRFGGLRGWLCDRGVYVREACVIELRLSICSTSPHHKLSCPSRPTHPKPQTQPQTPNPNPNPKPKPQTPNPNPNPNPKPQTQTQTQTHNST